MASAFKTLFTDLVNVGGNQAAQNAELAKQQIKVFVKETHPYFLVSDSYFYVPAYFTKAALDEFEKKFPSIKVQDLTEKVILITTWSLELKKVDSNAVFTSYAGLEVRLIVHSFKPQLGEPLHPTRWPTNLYRDDEFKTTIQHFRHRSIQASLEKVAAADVPLFSKGDVSQGIVSGKDDWQFKEGTTAVVALSGAAKKAAPAASTAAAKVKGGAAAKRSAKAATKAGAKKAAAKPAAAAAPAKIVEKVTKFTPGKKEGATEKGKKSASAKKAASPAGKKSAAGTTDHMTMQSFKKMIAF